MGNLSLHYDDFEISDHVNPVTTSPTMGKTKKAAAAPAPVADSAIDDIFAGPSKSKSDKSKTDKSEKKKKSGSGKEGAVEAAKKKDVKEKKSEQSKKEKDGGDKKESKPKKDKSEVVDNEPAVIEFVDPSAVAKAVAQAKQADKKRDRKAVDEDIAFRDSRGDGDREYSRRRRQSSTSGIESLVPSLFQALTPGRRTEEGYLIFKEAELAIDPEAGGTPLCPFDCECCKLAALRPKLTCRLLNSTYPVVHSMHRSTR